MGDYVKYYDPQLGRYAWKRVESKEPEKRISGLEKTYDLLEVAQRSRRLTILRNMLLPLGYVDIDVWWDWKGDDGRKSVRVVLKFDTSPIKSPLEVLTMHLTPTEFEMWIIVGGCPKPTSWECFTGREDYGPLNPFSKILMKMDTAPEPPKEKPLPAYVRKLDID